MPALPGYNSLMDEKTGFGLIGPGSIAHTHAEALRHSGKAYLTAVCGRDRERTGAFAAQYGAAAYTDIDGFLSDPHVEAVVITTPPGSHMELALKAIEMGKHVLVEKPMDTTPKRCGRIIDAARKRGVRTGCIFQARFYEGPRLVRKAIDEGRFGRLILVEASVKWNRSQEYYDSVPWRKTINDGGGVLMNQASHAIDLVCWFAGPVASVSGYTATLTHDGMEAEDNAAAVLRFSSGALGVVNASTSIHPGYPRRVEVLGTDGSAVLEDNDIVRWDFKEERPEDADVRSRFRAIRGESGAASNIVSDYSGHLAQLEDFSEAVRLGREPLVNGEEGMKSVELICKIYSQNGLI